MICYFVDSDPKSIPVVNKNIPRVSSGFNAPGSRKSKRKGSTNQKEILKIGGEEISSKMTRYGKMFRNYSVKQIALPGGKFSMIIFKVELQRVQSSPNGRFVYCGRNELKVLENMEGKYGLLKKGKNIRPFIDICLMRNGDLIVYDEETADLLKFDRDLRQIGRLPGNKTNNLGKKNFELFF